MLYIALLGGVAVSTVGSAITEPNSAALQVSALLLVGAACLALQWLVWRKYWELFLTPKSSPFFKRRPVLALFLSSVIGLAAGVAMYVVIK